MKMMMQKMALNGSSNDWKALGRGALYAVAGAFLTYATSAITKMDFGTVTPVIVSCLTIIINYLHNVVSTDANNG